MSIQPDVVKHVANLARLNITDEETTALTGQLSNILNLMTQLNQLDTETIEPMSHAVAMEIPEREDKVTNTDQREQMLANAPDSEAGHFRVPKVIE
ncbi:Asp-tRNA(Asn)/Glu-tRNA(Gln) amidotransferase subunit GatC [Magnetococcales bacterium HHB-1]